MNLTQKIKVCINNFFAHKSELCAFYVDINVNVVKYTLGTWLQFIKAANFYAFQSVDNRFKSTIYVSNSIFTHHPVCWSLWAATENPNKLFWSPWYTTALRVSRLKLVTKLQWSKMRRLLMVSHFNVTINTIQLAVNNMKSRKCIFKLVSLSWAAGQLSWVESWVNHYYTWPATQSGGFLLPSTLAHFPEV